MFDFLIDICTDSSYRFNLQNIVGRDKARGDFEEDKAKKTIHKAKVEDDEYKTEEQTYYSIAHTVHEVVTEQASIMVNGKLKEYQIKVIYLF